MRTHGSNDHASMRITLHVWRQARAAAPGAFETYSLGA